MTVATRLMTAEELERMPHEEARIELVRGEVVRIAPAGFEYGRIAATVLLLVGNFIRERALGTVYAAETGFILARNPDTVRTPDVAFVIAERALQQERQQGFFDGPPVRELFA